MASYTVKYFVASFNKHNNRCNVCYTDKPMSKSEAEAECLRRNLAEPSEHDEWDVMKQETRDDILPR